MSTTPKRMVLWNVSTFTCHRLKSTDCGKKHAKLASEGQNSFAELSINTSKGVLLMRTIQSNAFQESLKQLSKDRQRKRSPEEAHRNRIHGYGLTQSAYDDLLSKSGGCCGICKRKSQRLVIDHSHETGDVRGLLCGRCNSGLGMFLDSLKLLKRAAEYLLQSGTAIEIVEQAKIDGDHAAKDLKRKQDHEWVDWEDKKASKRPRFA